MSWNRNLLFICLPLFAISNISLAITKTTHEKAQHKKIEHDTSFYTNMNNFIIHNQDNRYIPARYFAKYFSVSALLGLDINYSTLHVSGGDTGPGQEMSTNPYTSGDEYYLDLNDADIFTQFRLNKHIYANAEFVRDYQLKINSDQKTLFFQQATLSLLGTPRIPLFFTGGIAHLNFGIRDVNQYTNTINDTTYEDLTSSYALMAAAGASLKQGFSSDVYVYENPSSLKASEVPSAFSDIQNKSRRFAVGGEADYLHTFSDDTSIHANAGLISDMSVATLIYQTIGSINNATHREHFQVPGLSLYAKADIDNFILKDGFIAALKRYSKDDLPLFKGPVRFNTPTGGTYTKGGQPWANSLEFAYNAHLNGTLFVPYVGYQLSGEAQAVRHYHYGGYSIPRYRVDTGFSETFMKYIVWKVEFDYDHDYSDTNGGTGRGKETIVTGVYAPIF
jgi:hypothetical protein